MSQPHLPQVPLFCSRHQSTRPAIGSRSALLLVTLAIIPWAAQAACTDGSAASAFDGSTSCVASRASYGPTVGPLLSSTGAGSLLTIDAVRDVTADAGTSGLLASGGGAIKADIGKLSIATTGVGNAFIGPVVARDPSSSITLHDVDAIGTNSNGTSTIGARDGATVTVTGAANVHLEAGEYNTAIDAQNNASPNAVVALGTSTLVTHIGPNGGAAGAAVAAESTGGGVGALVTALGPLTIRTDAVMGIFAGSGNAVKVQAVDIQTGVSITAPFTASTAPSGKTNAYGQGIAAVDTYAGVATVTFAGGTILSHVRTGIEARGNASVTSSADTAVTTTTAGNAAVLVNSTTAPSTPGSYTNQGALTVSTQGAAADGIAVLQGSASVTGALHVDVQGSATAPGMACATGAGVCLQGNGAQFSANPLGTNGSGHIASTGAALQMSSGTGQTAAMGGLALTTSGNAELVAIQGAAGTLALTRSTATAGSSGLAIKAANASSLFVNNAQTQITGDVMADSGSVLAMALTASSSLTGGITGAKADIDDTSVWHVTKNSTPARLNNGGAVNYPAPSGATFGTVTTTTDYGSLGGTLAMHTQLGDSSSPSDTLVVQQDVVLGASAKSAPLKAASAAPTKIAITNAGGAGAATTGNGILLVQVNGASPAGAFVLAAPVTAGAFTYDLVQVGSNWYLQSKLTPLVPPTIAGTAANGTVAMPYAGFSPALGPNNATPPVTLAVTAGSLPPGLTIDLTTGAISGTPTQAGTYTFTITATNPAGSAALHLTIVVEEAPTVPAVGATPVPGLGAWALALLAAAVAGLGRRRLRKA